MTATGGALAGVKAEWRSNPRLRAGAWVVLAILLVYSLLLLSDARAALRKDVQEQAEKLARIQSLAGQDMWAERAAEAARLREALESQLPAARTPGLAQAAMQGSLRELLAPYGDAVSVDVSAATVLPDNPGLVRVTATLGARDLGMARALALVQAIEAAPQLLTVPNASIEVRTSTNLSLTVNGFYRLQDEEAADAP